MSYYGSGQGRDFFRICNQDWGCGYELYESLVYQLLADDSPEQLDQFPLPLVIQESAMSPHPHQHAGFSDFVLFTKPMYVKWNPILIYISLTANVVKHLFNDLVTVQISLYVIFSFMFFPYFSAELFFFFLFIYRSSLYI